MTKRFEGEAPLLAGGLEAVIRDLVKTPQQEIGRFLGIMKDGEASVAQNILIPGSAPGHPSIGAFALSEELFEFIIRAGHGGIEKTGKQGRADIVEPQTHMASEGLLFSGLRVAVQLLHQAPDLPLCFPGCFRAMPGVRWRQRGRQFDEPVLLLLDALIVFLVCAMSSGDGQQTSQFVMPRQRSSDVTIRSSPS